MDNQHRWSEVSLDSRRILEAIRSLQFSETLMGLKVTFNIVSASCYACGVHL